MALFLTIIIAGIVVSAVAIIRDANEKKRCGDAVKVLRLLGYKDTQIAKELDRRGWKRGWPGKAKMLESIAMEKMHSCGRASGSRSQGS